MLFSAQTIFLFSVLIAGFSEQGAAAQFGFDMNSYLPAAYAPRSGSYFRQNPNTNHAQDKKKPARGGYEDEDDTYQSSSGGKVRFDAESSPDLISLLKKEFTKAKNQPNKKQNEKEIRPFRAPASVVNKAIKTWSKDPNKDGCNGNLNVAIFDDPPRCMSNPALPYAAKEIYAKKSSLVRRAGSCTYLTVVCLPDDFERLTSSSLIEKVNRIWKTAKGHYWTPPAICAPKDVVEKAWDDWNKKYLKGKKGVKFGKDICGKPSYESGINQGRTYAGFGKPSSAAQDYPKDHLLVECIE